MQAPHASCMDIQDSMPAPTETKVLSLQALEDELKLLERQKNEFKEILRVNQEFQTEALAAGSL